MRWPNLYFIFSALLATTVGCGGGLTQADLKRTAIKRPKDDETSAAAKSTPKETPSAEKKQQPIAAESADNKTAPAVPASPTNTPFLSLPRKTETPTTGTASNASPTDAEQPSSGSLVSKTRSGEFPTAPPQTSQAEQRTSGSERRPTRREEQEAEEERLAAIARETRKSKMAKRRTDDQAEDQATRTGNTPLKPGEAASTADLVKDLFDRLVHPEEFMPAEFYRVARELALAGASTEALAYYYAWATTTENDSDWAEQAAWSEALRRPVGTLHVGVGIEFTGPPHLLSKASPIGSHNTAFAGRSRDKSNNHLKKYTGELGDRLLIGLDERFEQAEFGPLFVPDPIENKRKRKLELKWQAKPTGFNPESIGTGLTLLGGGKRKELLYIAEIQGVDVLAVFDISLRQPRSGPLINITTVKLVDVRTGEELSSTVPLNNVRIAYDRQDRVKADPVEKEFTDLFDYVDASLALSPFPKGIRSEHATTRVKELSAGEYSNPLAVLAEMRLYFAKGLIDETTLLEGYQSLLGTNAAKQLVRGTVSEQVRVVAEYLPKIEPANK